MPDAPSPAQAVLEALGFVLFAREESRALRLLGKAPSWLTALWPALEKENRQLPVADASPFLENFLIDAEECWKKGGAERARSGPWIEQGGNGAEAQLEATAITAGGRAILLLEQLGEAFEARKAVLQRARETVIAHQRLNAEIQKKEILLHCVADEMTAALANIITALRLIELEENRPGTQRLLDFANRAAEEQRALIHRILGVFEAELRGIYSPAGETEIAADWNGVYRSALETAAPLFAEKGVRLDEAAAPTAQSVVLAVDSAHLERIVGNLLENALERSLAGGVVFVRAEEEPEALVVSFEDGGPILRREAWENLFAKLDPAKVASASAVRLHFCRIVAENSGGEIGCTPLPAGGNRFWIRLTKSGAAA